MPSFHKVFSISTIPVFAFTVWLSKERENERRVLNHTPKYLDTFTTFTTVFIVPLFTFGKITTIPKHKDI